MAPGFNNLADEDLEDDEEEIDFSGRSNTACLIPMER